MSTSNQIINMVVNNQGYITPSKVTLSKSMDQEVILSVNDDVTEIHCQFYRIENGKVTREGSSFTIGRGVTKTYDAKKHADGTHYLITTVDKNILDNIVLNELKLVDGQLTGVGLGEGGSGRIIIND